MERTRSSLTGKLDALEQKVTETVQGAASAVTETVENVKESVEATVETVKETVKDTFNLPLQVERHPWAMVAGSAALGFLGGMLLGPTRGSRGVSYGRSERAPTPAPQESWRSAVPTGPATSTSQSAASAQPSWFDQILRSVAPEIDKFKSLAIGAVAGMVRDMIVENASDSLKPHITERINELTSRLGGNVIHEPVLGETTQAQEDGLRGSTSC